jgi:putative ABC transport system permease protein
VSTWQRRLYRASLRLLPSSYRATHGAEIERLGEEYLDSHQHAGEVRRGFAFIALLAEAIAGAVVAHASKVIWPGMWRDIRQDVMHACRVFRRSPGFTLTAVLTIAMGVGATTAIFTVVRGVLLRPLPYADGERIANIWVDMGVGNQSLPAVSVGDFADYRARSRTFEEFAAATGAGMLGATGVLTGSGGEPEQVDVSGVSANFFSLLGVAPAFGRQFTAAEESPKGGAVVILSHGLWQRRYGSDPSIVGRYIDLDNVRHLVVGVLPPFSLLLPAEAFLVKDADVWKPLQLDYTRAPARNYTSLTVFGRTRPGVTMAQAQEEMSQIAQKLREEHAIHAGSNMRIRVVPLHHDIVKAAREPLRVLALAVALLLAIACANVAHLLLARGSGRVHEMAVRSALGASGWRLARQLAAENIVLAALGGAAGLALAQAALRVFLSLAPASLPRQASITMDVQVFAFSAIATLIAGLIFGVMPAIANARSANGLTLMRLGRGGSRAHGRIRRLLIAGEVALSLVLLVGAGLLLRSMIMLQQVRPGFDAAHVTTFGVSLPIASYPNGRARNEFVRRMEAAIAALPGVEAVGATSQLPLTGSGALSPYAYDEQTAANWESATADGRSVSPGYFRAMGTRLLAGRFFDDRDIPDPNRPDPNLRRVIIVDELLAARAFPGQSAVGQRLQTRPTGDPQPFAEIVGVVEHIRLLDVRRPVRGQIYGAYARGTPTQMSVVVRASGETATLATALRQTMRSLDPTLPVTVRPMSEYVTKNLAQTRFSFLLMAVFAVLAVLLAGIGIYGVMAYAVGQRTKEIGIRMALGEEPARIRNRVVGDGMKLVAISLALGLAGAFLLARAQSALLFGVRASDPVTFVVAPSILVAIAFLGSYLPARRAIRIDPLHALRRD